MDILREIKEWLLWLPVRLFSYMVFDDQWADEYIDQKIHFEMRSLLLVINFEDANLKMTTLNLRIAALASFDRRIVLELIEILGGYAPRQYHRTCPHYRYCSWQMNKEFRRRHDEFVEHLRFAKRLTM